MPVNGDRLDVAGKSGSDGTWNSTVQHPCIGDLLDEAASKWNSRVALYMSDGEWTFVEAARIARQEAGRLAAAGIGIGETVVSMLDNSLDAISIWLGANVLGAIHVPINTAYKGEYLRHHIGTARARIVFVEADLADRIEAILNELPMVEMVVVRGSEVSIEEGDVERITLEEWRERFNLPLAADAPKPEPSDVAALIFTSGTTGASKAVMISHNYMQHAASVHNTFGRPLDEAVYLPFRAFHLAVPSWILETLMTGAPVVVPNAFSVSRFWSDVNRLGATMAVMIGNGATPR